MMKTLEEQLWDYIDGSSTAEEKKAIELLLMNDAEAQSLYSQLLELNLHFDEIEIDEPSMSFTRNVMEKVALEVPPVALKTKIDRRIIFSIGVFFITAIIAVFVYAAANSNTALDVKVPAIDLQFNADKYINATTLRIFLLIDVIAALLLFDNFLRRKLNIQKEAK